MSNLALTIRESIRYRGRSGHWSWVAHRISGLAILLFLTIHVWDTATAFYSPNLYAWFVAVFKWPPIAIGEIPLMAAVLFHAFNGIRISILDFKPELWKHQKKSTQITWGLFLILFIPIGIFMAIEMVHYWQELGSAWMQFPSLSDYLS
jgi:succinate dehydrogenase / fumarate reductase, cytochrome b subunit